MPDQTKHTLKAIKEIQKKEGRNRGVSGTIPCPRCQASLTYTIAKSNGHIWGKCSTKDCLQWVM